MEQVSQCLQRHEFVAVEEMLTRCLPESIVQTMNGVEEIEQRVLVGLDAMPVIQPEESLSGSLTTFHQRTSHVASLNELDDLPLRASNEGLLRPRVARVQKIIRFHTLPFIVGSASTENMPVVSQSALLIPRIARTQETV